MYLHLIEPQEASGEYIEPTWLINDQPKIYRKDCKIISRKIEIVSTRLNAKPQETRQEKIANVKLKFGRPINDQELFSERIQALFAKVSVQCDRELKILEDNFTFRSYPNACIRQWIDGTYVAIINDCFVFETTD